MASDARKYLTRVVTEVVLGKNSETEHVRNFGIKGRL